MIHQTELARVFRADSGKILAALVAQSHDMELAEDALQEALMQASEQWRMDAVPDNPSAWLFTAARRRLTDQFRKQQVRSREENTSAIYNSLYEQADCNEEQFDIPEERLRLIFTCCHPALSQEAQIGLTLKLLCGLSVREIARAFLTSESAMEQRITRAKRKIKQAGITYKVPENSQITERVSSVLKVIYLIYNESYCAYEGQTLTRGDFATEAIRLARMLFKLLPSADVQGLLALLLLHDARRPARYDRDCGFISLEDQDRCLWNQSLIREGEQMLNESIVAGKPCVFKIQAAISALHCQASHWEKTDWKQIVYLYRSLYRLDSSPIVYLNLTVAIANVGELKRAYEMLLTIKKPLNHYQPYYAAKAHISAKLNKKQTAQESYIKAIELTKNEIERNYLRSKLAILLGEELEV